MSIVPVIIGVLLFIGGHYFTTFLFTKKYVLMIAPIMVLVMSIINKDTGYSLQ